MESQISNSATAEAVPESGRRVADSTQLRLDDLTLQRFVGAYPDELREPVMWLGWFARERCHRDLDILVTRAKALDISFDKTNWSKTLRGKWNRDRDNAPLPSPIIALPKLLKAIEALRCDDRLHEMAGHIPFVETTTTRTIFDFIDARRAPERINRFGIIVGYTGTQKTVSAKQYCRLNNHGMCVWMESPENGSVKEFVAVLAGKYGGGTRDTWDNNRRRIIETVNSRKTIILDNSQALYKPQTGAKQQVFDFLRRIQDETQCTIILMITPEFHKSILLQMINGYFEQFEGRAGGRDGFLILPDFPPEEDCVTLARAFGLEDAEKHAAYLVALARKPGRIRVLLEDLQAAKVESESRKKKLTITHLRALREEAA